MLPALWAVPVTPSNSLWTLNFPFTSSTFKTNILSVDIPKISFGLIFLEEKSPATSMLVTIPVALVFPSSTFKVNRAVLNPIRCWPSIPLRLSVDKPETVTTSPLSKSWGWGENPMTFPVWLS